MHTPVWGCASRQFALHEVFPAENALSFFPFLPFLAPFPPPPPFPLLPFLLLPFLPRPLLFPRCLLFPFLFSHASPPWLVGSARQTSRRHKHTHTHKRAGRKEPNVLIKQAGTLQLEILLNESDLRTSGALFHSQTSGEQFPEVS